MSLPRGPPPGWLKQFRTLSLIACGGGLVASIGLDEWSRAGGPISGGLVIVPLFLGFSLVLAWIFTAMGYTYRQMALQTRG